MREFERIYLVKILNFRGQQISVLIADLPRRALQVHKRPPIHWRTPKRALQPLIGLRCRGSRDRRENSHAANHRDSNTPPHVFTPPKRQARKSSRAPHMERSYPSSP